jgi:hypothetical protein
MTEEEQFIENTPWKGIDLETAKKFLNYGYRITRDHLAFEPYIQRKKISMVNSQGKIVEAYFYFAIGTDDFIWLYEFSSEDEHSLDWRVVGKKVY